MALAIRTAMFLAAGLGTRMRPLSEQTPKPLIPVAGKALMDHVLDAAVDAGVERAVVNVHYLADQVEAHMANRTDIEVIISDERDCLLETGGAIVRSRANRSTFKVEFDGKTPKNAIFWDFLRIFYRRLSPLCLSD